MNIPLGHPGTNPPRAGRMELLMLVPFFVVILAAALTIVAWENLYSRRRASLQGASIRCDKKGKKNEALFIYYIQESTLLRGWCW